MVLIKRAKVEIAHVYSDDNEVADDDKARDRMKKAAQEMERVKKAQAQPEN